ncbi:hypothetical protein FE257_003744 [Aspergillus nanangensis]|uniref:Major facilitator superfamily (MFS) profile domain-containing protein n=1 Tax=Aspergillus nanangensis TaxID=2582783 RepID=A0AAD4CBD7_ASPNN|nr:hypothetical protein FE257_003744 [Aspergillus nanangensis]
MGARIPNSFNLGVVIFVAVGSIACSYGMSVISVAIGQDSFFAAFDLAGPGQPGYAHTSRILSAMTGVNVAGSAVGALLAGWGCDALGRKTTLKIGAGVLAAGAALCAGSVALSMFLVARCIAGIGVGVLITVIPMYQAEVSTPESRGLMVGMHGIMFGVGYSLAGWIGVGTYFYKDVDATSSFTWRFPFAFQALPAVILCSGVYFLPSSPRWLLEQNRPQEARTILERLYRSSEPDCLVQMESQFAKMQTQLSRDRENRAKTSPFEIFSTASNRRRALVGAVVMFGNQLTGIYVNSSYGVLIYSALGFSDAWPLILSAIWVSCSIPGNIWAAVTVDRFGRVRLMLIGLVGTACTLLCECVLQALYLGTSNTAGQKAAVLFVFLSIFFWSFFIDAVQYVYLSEIFPTRIRSQGMAVGMVAYYAALVVILIAGPIALDSITWKFFIVLLVITCAQTVLVFFLCPETKQMSLDDVDLAFQEPVAGSASHRKEDNQDEVSQVQTQHVERVESPRLSV